MPNAVGQLFKTGTFWIKPSQIDYEAFITTDRNLKYQQNLTNRTISILVLTTTS